jgi:caffeoyl-CoA O-methyltransferase
MTRTSISLTPPLHEYVVAHGTPPDEVVRALIAETAALGDVARMQIAPEQGALLTLLTRLVNARFAVEVGSFTGYSGIAIARGLAEDGRLLACDISEEWTSIARRYWERAGVAERIDLRLAPAQETLRALPEDAVIDFAFVDADKPGYIDYWEALVPRMRPNGLIVVDNVLFYGEVIDLAGASESGLAIHAFNEHILGDDRMERVMLPVADGLTLARKK